MITRSGVDWASLLLQTLDESPILLLLPDLHHKPCERRKHINPWQCHVLASFLSSLVPRIRAEIIDWKLCSSSYTHTNRSYNNNYASCSDTIPKEEEGDDDEEEISHIHKNVHIALRELLTSIRKAENYFVHHVNYDHDPEFLLLATSCNGEALCVHIHNIFWCFSGFVLVARLFHGYSDVKLSGLIEEQIHCWDDMVSQYIELGAENLDLQHMASVMRTQSGDNILNSSWPMKHLLSERLDLLILTQGKEKAEGKVILDLLKIDFKDLVGIKKKKFESENDNDGDGLKKHNTHMDHFEATLGGVKVSLQRFSSIVACRKHAAMLLQVTRNPFILQLLGWSSELDGGDDDDDCNDRKTTICYLVMESTQSDLKSSISLALMSASNGIIKPTSTAESTNGECLLPNDHQRDHIISPFPFHIALDMMLQIARGMWYLHHNGIAHKNLCSSSISMTDPSKPSHRQKFYDVLLSDEAPGLHTRIKLFGIGSDDHNITSHSIDPNSNHYYHFHEDVKSFGHLCTEILTGKKSRGRVKSSLSDPNSGISANDDQNDGETVSNLILPLSIPTVLKECVRACCDPNPENRPEFSAICGLLRRLKLVVYYNPSRLERVLKENELATIYDHNQRGIRRTDESIFGNILDCSVSFYDLGNTFTLKLIDINVKLLYTSTPKEIYAHVASEALLWMNGEDSGSNGVSNMNISMKVLSGMATKLREVTADKEKEKEKKEKKKKKIQRNGSNPQWKHSGDEIITSNASTLETTMVVDGYGGLLKNGWINTTMGLGTLEMWLNMRYMANLEWKQVQKVGLGIALCVRYVSKSSLSPKVGSYSYEQGHCIDGFYPIYPSNILLNSQLKVALLLDNTTEAWTGLVQWAGVHPQLLEGGHNTLLSFDAYTTFYYGHLLDGIIRARHNQFNEQKTTLSPLDQHFKNVLSDLAQRCIQLNCLSMSDVVTTLLDSECGESFEAPSHEIESSQTPE